MKKTCWIPIKKLQKKDSGATSFSSMEQPKNKTHPSLPSNYVTLAQLQERWLKQKNQQQKQEEEEEEKQQKQKLQEEEEEKHVPVAVAVVAPSNVTVSRSHPTVERQHEEKQMPVVAPTNGTVSRSRPAQEQHRRRNRISSNGKRRMEEATSENRRNLVNGGEIGENQPKSESSSGIGENQPKSEIREQKEEKQVHVAVAPTNVTISRSHPAPERHRRKNRNDSGDKRLTDDAASDNRRKLENRAGIGENRLKTKTGAVIGENGSKAVIDDGIGVENADLNGKLKKEKKKKWWKKWKGKVKPKVEEEKGRIENATAERENEVAEKTTVESELNDKNVVNSIIVEKVEEKIGDLSMNPRNGKQNENFRRVNNGFRQSQSQFQSNNRRGGYGYRRFRGERHSNVPMVWVKKDD